MRSVFCAILLILGSQTLLAIPVQVKAFREWKLEKVQQIQARISSDMAQIELLKQKKAGDPALTNSKALTVDRTKTEASVEALKQHYEKQISQEQWNLEVAQDLSVTDYIVLYLAAQPTKTKFQEAAGQLSPTEVAELMEAYSQNLGVKMPTPSEGIAGAPSPSTIRSASMGQR